MREKVQDILRKAGVEGAEVTVPEKSEFGHFATAVALKEGKRLKRKPMDIAKEIAAALEERAPKHFFSKIDVAPPGFVNMWIAPEAIQKAFSDIRTNRQFGKSTVPRGKVIIEYSSVNVAKPMHVGHLRNTILGDALARLYADAGYEVVRWNYLGDWGTQFGKVIAAYKKWGSRAEVERDPITVLTALYVRFHAEAKDNDALDHEGREEFRKLEAGDKENRSLWSWFCELSLAEFNRLYAQLGVAFDETHGESFFEQFLPATIAALEEKGLTKKSEGALIVPLDKEGLPPALVQKSDGASLYLTRDLANIRYRIREYKPKKILYVVGSEQSLSFEQLFAIIHKAHWDAGVELVHVKYGLVLDANGKKLSTREGAAITAKTLIDEAILRARKVVDEKSKTLSAEEKESVSKSVGIGALKYANLRENRNSAVAFNWDTMLDFSGDSGPYLQYTHVRLRSILRKAESRRSGKAELLTDPRELALILKMAAFPDVIELAADAYAPNFLSTYLIEFANDINRFYEHVQVLGESDEAMRNARLDLVEIAARTLAHGLHLLGIDAPEEM